MRHLICRFGLIAVSVAMAACATTKTKEGLPQAAGVVAAQAAYQGNRILTFGGGPNPLHSQASLEQNVLFFRRVLAGLGLEQVRNDIYFTDGAGARSVELMTPQKPAMEFSELMAGLFNENPEDVQLQFRAPRIPGVAGPSTPGAIAHWFETTGASMRPNERLLVYFTGHGSPLRNGRMMGPDGGNAPVLPGSLMNTWNETSISTREFVGDLDKLDPNVDVAVVMVQCFSGGFANIIYKEGDPAKGLSKAHRCGFFSTTSMRVAAGCTADIEGDDYQEFSTFFFAALAGKTRGGQVIARPDYDHDGRTTFTEAFTYVLLTSNTIDIPMTTSDQLLRDKSRMWKRGDKDSIMKSDALYSEVAAAATPAQKAALEGLSAQLGLKGEGRLADARNMASSINRQRTQEQEGLRQMQTDMYTLRNKIRLGVLQQWPELALRWHPDYQRLVTTQSGAILHAIKTDPSFAAYMAAQEKLSKALTMDFDEERKWVKTQRLLARADTVILAANLERVATPEINAFYKQLVGRENETLSDWGKVHQ